MDSGVDLRDLIRGINRPGENDEGEEEQPSRRSPYNKTDLK